MLDKTTGIRERIKDALFLWENNRKESAFALALIAVASTARLRYPRPQVSDKLAFTTFLKDCHTVRINVEFRGSILPVEDILYSWVRCELIHEGSIPVDIQFMDETDKGFMSVRAGGQPENLLKIGTGWFSHMINSIDKAPENQQSA